MYERILEAIQQLKEQGVEPTKLFTTIDHFIVLDRELNMQVVIKSEMPEGVDFIIM